MLKRIRFLCRWSYFQTISNFRLGDDNDDDGGGFRLLFRFGDLLVLLLFLFLEFEDELVLPGVSSGVASLADNDDAIRDVIVAVSTCDRFLCSEYNGFGGRRLLLLLFLPPFG